MGKTKILKKQKESFRDMPTLELKKNVHTKKFSATKRMTNKKRISKALWACLVDFDVDGFKEILRTHLEIVSKDKISKETGLSKRTLFRMLSDDGNPTLENVAKLLHKICI
ncbi:MAG: hypothetical protein A2504_16305 [Bdellovibrionales bacterium RIFOXYD12_FULL_39_22]|nr:MAG: hypothetical protein A2385_08215 [Bdellovibrionales bacterium RIFOXYB1_FULL_39_21]OFZ44027.1 MAG: hypothetical protein A2485_07870 [Bdellovibrionales bacterium RIFOXYC12_FULL_39_17]OFZ50955.1 MAG: hypothetical protein A2404_07130 [Bdellovibrionales bacterium RIFOXYC1_FULL_39_130]OFZ78178.1 MAG: hypothetical protein A2560_02300 [Bdellovibrionales bacterium RIFOXYD1_FULL_39_84]OFZ94046.1 MAG: hypothetical protein A2504_16305 [Bdellovibrionales bacterium RIFOXYD12_FULL_39_22]HLE11611.1 hy